MIAEPALQEEEFRALDPNVRQRRASDPGASVWVGASAGTGKTKVLTDRVLRLLLPRRDGHPGTAPLRILCLTFTKAAASEMVQRISATLSVWATLPEEDFGPDKKGLKTRLRELTGYEAGRAEIDAARRLFASVVDTPGGLKVMTIHSFCQSVLGRFPLEAGIPPHFSVVDEGPAQELLARARNAVLERARQEPDSPLGRAVIAIAAEQNEEQFGMLLQALCGERQQLQRAAADPERLYGELCALFGVNPADTPDSLKKAACEDATFDRDALYAACRALANGTGKSDQPRGLAIQRWLDAAAGLRLEGFDEYESQLLTKDGQPRKSLSTKSVQQADPACEPALQAEAQRLGALRDAFRALKCVCLTRDLMLVGSAILQEYQTLKDARALLDYDDLILTTLSLLRQEGIAPWILYKLDGGLDHVLIDEAQDTNPEQWQIIQRLCEDFFSGEGARSEVTRTVFTVGDEKQSIYSFQRASPGEFARMKAYFMGKGAQEEKLDISFRSAASVLGLVDEVFAPPALRQGLGGDILKHHSFRRGQAGLAELWPLFSPDEAAEEEPWSPPVRVVEAPSGQAKLADHIGATIERWLNSGEILESQGRAVEPGNIMVLVRTRTAFVNQLVRALKTRNIPVSGVDRMVLGEQIAVMDMLALAQFALLPADDLSLACALKSPLIGLDEDQLFALAARREGSLWGALRASAHEPVIKWLEDLISHAAYEHPYEFFSRILQRPCPADKVSGQRAMVKRLGADALDPLGEFLNAALAFETNNIPTLQGFLLWQQKSDAAIKRELEEAGGAVRIMTVHGSKGLQAPIVILPDTTRTAAAKKNGNLLWPDKTGLSVPLWAPRSEDFPALYRQARTRLDDAMEEEYRRLLYVALTRAEDRLYIGGCKGRREPLDECWYNYVAAAFDRLPDVEEGGNGIRRIRNPQTAEPDLKKKKETRNETTAELPPDWLFQPASAEAFPPRPLIPSRPAEAEPAVSSPLKSGEDYRFRRGNITHKLLQILPDLPPAGREQAARHFVARPAHELPAALQEDIVRETLAILSHPAYAPLFGPDSLAEVPLTGFVNGRLVSAQIDRLLVTDRAIWIVDYKTNRPPPTEEKDVPAIYRDQLTSYRDIVANIYPGRPIRCFLLWTDGPLLMPLTIL